jgi:2-amino-4-hydroxy-6-hydroxymethyldihydropteridine diphosphokinase
MIEIKMVYTYLSLGTNMGNRVENLRESIRKVDAEIGSVKSISSIFESEPWGFETPQYFLNMVIGVFTSFSPLSLLQCCKNIENMMGRAAKLPGEGYTSRPIDIDILFYGNEIISETTLVVPHQHLHNRRFVLDPLYELDPLLVHPVMQKTVEELLLVCPDKLMVKKIGVIDYLSSSSSSGTSAW